VENCGEVCEFGFDTIARESGRSRKAFNPA
jgi:hypothetical protein